MLNINFSSTLTRTTYVYIYVIDTNWFTCTLWNFLPICLVSCIGVFCDQKILVSNQSGQGFFFLEFSSMLPENLGHWSRIFGHWKNTPCLFGFSTFGLVSTTYLVCVYNYLIDIRFIWFTYLIDANLTLLVYV